MTPGRRSAARSGSAPSSADDDLRPEVVAALTRPGRLPPDRADALLDANAVERALASRVLLAEATEVLAEAGILRPQHTVLDLSLRQVQALAATLGKLASWWPQPALEQHHLGDVLKVIPREDATFVLHLLAWGGWLREVPAAQEEEQG
jgi:hypothetical protein